MEEFNSFLEAERDLRVLRSELNRYNREFNEKTDVKQAKFRLKQMRDRHIESTKAIREKVKTATETVNLRKEILANAMVERGRNELTDERSGIVVKLKQEVKKLKKKWPYRKNLY